MDSDVKFRRRGGQIDGHFGTSFARILRRVNRFESGLRHSLAAYIAQEPYSEWGQGVSFSLHFLRDPFFTTKGLIFTTFFCSENETPGARRVSFSLHFLRRSTALWSAHRRRPHRDGEDSNPRVSR